MLVRGDVDAKPGAKIGDGDIRLRSMVDTLQFGRQRGWKQIVFGHIGRKPEGSLAKVAKRLGELLDCDVPLIADWLDESTTDDSRGGERANRRRGAGRGDHARKHAQVRRSSACSGRPSRPICRRWRRSWPSWPTSSPRSSSTIYVFEALSAGSLDACSVAVPAAMEQVALGEYVAERVRPGR